MDLAAGQLVAGNQYRVVRRLGAGGFGAVYLVETVVGGLRRALKILRPEWARDGVARERFVNEALVLEEINHPNVARCYAAGVLDDGGLYLLLEFVPGQPVAAMLEPDAGGPRRPLPPVQAIRIARHVAAGLSVAHARGVLHRDLKPANVMVVDPGGLGEQVKLVDFGIARAIAADVTATAGVVGTPAYLAPEQIRRELPLDARLDLFQLGVTLYVMLTGEQPYASGEDLVQLVAAHEAHRDAGPLPSACAPALAGLPALDRLVSRLLAADRERRPRSAAQVCEELTRIEHALAPADDGRGPLGLLEALCAAPGDAAWWALCRFLIEQGEGAERLVATADMLLREWPDELRKAPQAWWDEARRRGDAPLWPLVRALDLSGRGLSDDDVMALAENPALGTITVLDLAGNQVGNEGAAALAASPFASSLRALNLANNRLTSAGVERIAGGRLERLERLTLSGNGLGARAAEALAGSRLRLRDLDLTDNCLQAAGAAALVAGDALSGLERLAVAANTLGSDGMSALALSRTLGGLVELDVSHNGIGPGGAAALALSSAMASLRRLSLAANRIGLRGVELLLASSRFGALEMLDISSNEIGAQGAMVLASSPFARRLKGLDISDNGLGDAGVAALLGAPHLSGLRVLGLAQNGLTPAGATLLAGAPPEIETLDLSENAFGPDGAAAIAAIFSRLRLRALKVNGCVLGAQAAAQVVSAGAPRLESLDARRCGIDSMLASSLEAVGGTALQRLDLSENPLDADAVAVLSRVPALRGVRELALDSTSLGQADPARLGRVFDTWPALESLSLRDNGLRAPAAAALAASATARRLATLDLSSNLLADAGVEALRRGAWPLLRSLGLQGNDVSLAAATSVAAASGMALLHRIDLSRNAVGGQQDLHSLGRRTIAILEASFERLAGSGADFAERFYGALFSRYPGLRPLFASASMKRQQQHLMSTLALVVEHLRHPDAATAHIEALGERHVDYRVSPSHYHAVTGVLLETMRAVLQEDWTGELEAAWHDGLDAIASTMIAAHRRRRSGAAAAVYSMHADGGCPVRGPRADVGTP